MQCLQIWRDQEQAVQIVPSGEGQGPAKMYPRWVMRREIPLVNSCVGSKEARPCKAYEQIAYGGGVQDARIVYGTKGGHA